MTLILVLVIAVVVIAAGVVLVSQRRPNDGVSSFQRQIDALSPEARRTVVDQVHNVQGDRDGDAVDTDGEEDADGA